MVEGNKEQSFAVHGSDRHSKKGSGKGIKHGHAGRQLHETEHHERMEHEVSDHPANPSGDSMVY